MKTIKQWFEELPEPFKSQAIKNLIPEKSEVEADSLAFAINTGIDWHQTTQGWDYWESIYFDLGDGLNYAPLDQWKTIEEWLKELPEPHRTQALANMEPYGKRIMKESLITALWAAFPFHEANEGGEYWDEFVLLLYNDRT